MVAARANWKGYIKFGEVACAVALFTASSSSERIAFNTLNRATGNHVRREFVDSETGDPVEREDQVKGDEIDDVYFDKPYYLAPDRMGADAFGLLRDGMRQAKVAALARTVLFRRLRTVLIRPHGKGLIGTTLNFDYEVRSAKEAFEDIPAMKIEGEMLDLAKHIINTKKGSFDAKSFDDRYDAAVAELVKAKIEGKPLPKKKVSPPSKPSDLLQALRQSAGLKSSEKTKRPAAKSKPSAKEPKRAANSKRAA
jgi:DNA end-binding protein Ku